MAKTTKGGVQMSEAGIKAISNSILFNNPQQEEIELLSYDKVSGYAMIHNLNRTYMPYAVVSGLDVRTGEWSAGHYFSNEKEAYDFHREQINAFDEKRYRHAVEYLIREEFEAIGENLSDEKISELYDRVVMESDEAKILNTNIFEDMEEYLTKEDMEQEEGDFDMNEPEMEM